MNNITRRTLKNIALGYETPEHDFVPYVRTYRVTEYLQRQAQYILEIHVQMAIVRERLVVVTMPDRLAVEDLTITYNNNALIPGVRISTPEGIHSFIPIIAP